ncbi:MFS transporter [Clostridium estertheticum]|uniref:MFS transporter n=1 Tax=Clostridium estertheticum TaxID=238834 RepID=UPI00398C2803
MFSRVVLDMGVGLIFPLSTALIADFFSGDERISMMGFSQASSNLGGIITTILSGVLAKLSWRYAFYVYLIGVLVLLLIVELPLLLELGDFHLIVQIMLLL